ncbi:MULTISPECIES: hypothetical protein [Bacteria]|jgi:hypothetical protein|nr:MULTISPECIES: hypothetical protein [Enterobacteriaceae]ELM7818502.1 hypothetical protein [Escherichia coli]MBS0871404.1 hypothetical protein [Enterobacter ludwigii]MCE0322009.1 hypothetical protein [Klebsiella pneumoniae]MCS6316125.1 hypothetical protein [Escherichia coli]MCV2046710.1 hypothetical protein [Escherichia coli]
MISRKSALTGYIQSKKVSLNMTFSITEGREDRIGSLVITKELYDKLEKYSRLNGLITSTYNHGHGVVRYYTVKYCLQMNYHGQNQPQKYLIKRGGRYPSKYATVKKTIEELEYSTPTFDAICRNIAKKYPHMVKFTNYISETPLKGFAATFNVSVGND